MKKSSLLLFVFLVLVFSLTGCTLKNQNSKHSNRVKKVTGEVKKAKVDEEGNILIQEKDITNKVTYISYEYEAVTIGLLAVRDSKVM